MEMGHESLCFSAALFFRSCASFVDRKLKTKRGRNLAEYPLSFSVSFLLQLMPIYRHPGKALEFFYVGEMEALFSATFF